MFINFHKVKKNAIVVYKFNAVSWNLIIYLGLSMKYKKYIKYIKAWKITASVSST